MLSDYDNVVTRAAQSPNSGRRSKFTCEVISDISDRTQLIVRHTSWRILWSYCISPQFQDECEDWSGTNAGQAWQYLCIIAGNLLWLPEIRTKWNASILQCKYWHFWAAFNWQLLEYLSDRVLNLSDAVEPGHRAECTGCEGRVNLSLYPVLNLTLSCAAVRLKALYLVKMFIKTLLRAARMLV